MKTNRVIVWFLLLFMVLLIVSGYGLTKPNLVYSLSGGIIDYPTALYLHITLDVAFAILLLTHAMIEIKFSLMRWGFKNQKLLNLLMLMLGSIFLVLIVYVDGSA